MRDRYRPGGLSLDVVKIRGGMSEEETLRTIAHEAKHIEQMLSERLPRLAPQCTDAQRWAAEEEARSYEEEALGRYAAVATMA